MSADQSELETLLRRVAEAFERLAPPIQEHFMWLFAPLQRLFEPPA